MKKGSTDTVSEAFVTAFRDHFINEFSSLYLTQQSGSYVHPTAIVHPTAVLGENVKVGPFVIIGDHVEIGPNTIIDAYVRIRKNTRIGSECIVSSFADLGGDPQDLSYGGEETFLEIGNGTTIREHTSIHRGTATTGLTSVGSGCFIMGQCHIGHDVTVKDHVIMSQGTKLAGHAVIEEYVVLGGMTGVMQHVRIGRYCMIGAMSKITRDVPPYMLADGIPCSLRGINLVGLRRHGFSRGEIAMLNRVAGMMADRSATLNQIIERLGGMLAECDRLKDVLQFLIAGSKRGFLLGMSTADA